MNGEDRFNSTMEALGEAETGLPTFSGSYDSVISGLFDKIINRKKFSYDIYSDPLYSAYRDAYTREGSLAMRDTLGSAAALTGGYSSSYAQSVGQQQYGAYLRKLGDIMPELYSSAYDRYVAEGNALNSQLEAASGLAETEYNRFTNERSTAMELEQRDYERKWAVYQNLISLISGSGYVPEAAELEATGMTEAQAEALRQEYLRSKGLLNTGGAAVDATPYGTYSKSKASTGADRGTGKEEEKLAAVTSAKGTQDKSRRK